ncbi:MAG: glycoside hydrolase family 3 N-terminal domain-containing protein [Lachnospiraceae bacterium]
MIGDRAQAAALALSAGVDVSLWDGVFPYLEESVKKGLLEESLLDEAVRRVLTLKFEQGLFGAPISARENASFI